MTAAGALLLATVAAPLALAAGAVSPRWQGLSIRLAPWAALPGLLAALLLPPDASVSASWVLLGTTLGLDATGQIFLGFTALLWLLSAAYGRAYLAGDARRARFFGAFLLAMAGNLGLCLARDMVSFYLFFALMTFASYPLVVHDRSEAALAAGRVYIRLAVVGELLLFAGLVLLAAGAGTLALPGAVAGLSGSPRQAPVTVLLLLGFGIKAGTVPLHLWLPLAHPAAPTPASAVLSGAMIKAGLLGWLRFLPLGEASLPALGLALAAAGVAGVFYGILVGLSQDNPKALLAYSSVSQMGFLTVAVGLGLAEPAVWSAGLPAVTAYALHHGLAKGALFLGVGAAGACGRRAGPWVAVGLALPALSLAGAPFTSGAAAKAALKAAVALGPGGWPAWLGWLLPLAAVGTAALLTRFLFLLRPLPSAEGRITAGILGPWCLLVLASAAAAWGGAPPEPGPSALWGSLWPVAAGAAAALAARRTGWGFPVRVPPGDLLGPLARAGAWLGRITEDAGGVLVLAARRVDPRPLASLREAAGSRLEAAEAGLGRWASLGVVFLLAALVQFGLFLWGGIGGE